MNRFGLSSLRLALGAFAMTGAALVGLQQLGAQGIAGHDSNAPVNYAADRIELQDKAHRVVLSGNVDVTQGDLRMRAARSTVAYTNDGALKIQRLDATGGVTVTRVSRLADGTFPGQPVNDLGWEIHPQGLVDVIGRLHERYPGPVWVTENGVCDATDAYRARFIHDHLGALAASGLPVERYYHWCLVDNWEWSDGEVPRFGIVHLDHRSQERTVKDSGRFLAEAARRGEVTEEMYDRFVAGQEYPRG